MKRPQPDTADTMLTNGGGEYEVNVTSEPQNHTSRKDQETDKAAQLARTPDEE